MVESRISSCGSSRTSFRSPQVTTAPVELRVTITLLVHTGIAELPAIDPHVLLAITNPSDAGATPTEEPPGICIADRNPHNTDRNTCTRVVLYTVLYTHRVVLCTVMYSCVVLHRVSVVSVYSTVSCSPPNVQTLLCPSSRSSCCVLVDCRAPG